MIEATINEALRLLNIINKIKIIIRHPSIKLFLIVEKVLLIILVRSKKGSITTPSGNAF